MKRHTKLACLSLGSNLGDRAGHIESAVGALEGAGVQVRRHSALYESEPVDMNPQRWFLNCLVEVETELMPLALLRVLKRIERLFGRHAAGGVQPAARLIDLDILYYGRHVVRMPELTIPHPRLAERRFVLKPLQELAPDWHHPVTCLTPAEMLAGLSDHAAVRRVTR